jgi:hypothetical protein
VSATGIAALIAAASFAVLALTGVYLAIRVTRVVGDAATLVRETRAGQEALLVRANAAVDRANDQLDRAAAVNASMDELGAGMADLAGQATALAAFGKTVAGAVVGGPVGKAAAVAYGVRHAVALRRGGKRASIPGRVLDGGARHASAPVGGARNGGARNGTVRKGRELPR